MSLVSTAVRSFFQHGDDRRDAGLGTPAGIVRHDDIAYGPDPKWNLLDLYLPESGQPGGLPVIVSVHGGVYVYGDKERYQYYCMSLAEHSFAVVNFSYRLAPAHKFPAQLEDTVLAFAWVLEHAAQYGLDEDRIFAVGDSVGAQLLALYCCLCTNPEYASLYPFRVKEGFRPAAVALNCGVYDFGERKTKDREKDGGSFLTWKDGRGQSRKGGFSLLSLLLPEFLENKGTPEELRLIRVSEHVTSDFPPALIMTGEGDIMASAALPMAEQLRDLGVPVEYRYYGDREHVLGHVFHCNVRSAYARMCSRDECAFFKGFCR